MRRAVCRCLRGAVRSASRIRSMKACTGANVGFARAWYGRTGGTASANACRTTRRWTPNFRDTPLIVPTPTLILPPNLRE